MPMASRAVIVMVLPVLGATRGGGGVGGGGGLEFFREDENVALDFFERSEPHTERRRVVDICAACDKGMIVD